MENFRFHVSTDIRFGKDRLGELPEVLNQFGKRVLLVYGGGSVKKSGLYDKIMHLLTENGNEVFEVAGVEPNPRIETVQRGADLCKKEKIDVILAVGGGSVIDCSKAISGGAFEEGDLWEMVKRRGYMGPTLPIVTILTLAATGSEMNGGSVISNLKTKQKLGFGGRDFLPKVSFLDPTLTFSVSQYQTAAGSADIMSHLMENYFDATPATDVEDGIAEGLMRAVIKNAPIAIENPEDYDARSNLMWASSLALNGLTGASKKGVWSCHPMEHELSAVYDITHGVGLAILTPRWMEYILNDATAPKFARFAREVWGIQESVDELAARMGIQKLYDYFVSCGIPMTLPEVGIATEEEFASMAKQCIEMSRISELGFAPIDAKDVVNIYQACMTPSSFI